MEDFMWKHLKFSSKQFNWNKISEIESKEVRKVIVKSIFFPFKKERKDLPMKKT
jgi:hypothetical protein